MQISSLTIDILLIFVTLLVVQSSVIAQRILISENFLTQRANFVLMRCGVLVSHVPVLRRPGAE
jgi:hypothetical protein